MAGLRKSRTLVPRKGRTARATNCARNETRLDICPGVLSDKVIHGILDDWLIPMMVERILRDRSTHPNGPFDT
jgi:hypothetical protein